MRSQEEPRSHGASHSISWNLNLEWNSNVWPAVLTFLMLTIFLSILKKVSKMHTLEAVKRQALPLPALSSPDFTLSEPVLSFPSHSQWSHRRQLLGGSHSTQDDLFNKEVIFILPQFCSRRLRLLKVSTLCPWLSRRPIFLLWSAVLQGGVLQGSQQEGLELSGSRWSGSRPHWAAAGAGAELFWVLVLWDVLN